MLPEGRSELDRMVDVDASPLISGSEIYGLAFQGRLMSMSLRDGQPRWDSDVSGFLNLAEGLRQVYVVDEDDGVVALDQSSGEVTWQHELLAHRKLTSPLAYSNYLVVGDEAGYLHVMAQSDGRMLGRSKVGGKGLRTDLAFSDGVFYALDNKGSLHAFEIATR